MSRSRNHILVTSLLTLTSMAFAQAPSETATAQNERTTSSSIKALPCRPTIACTADIVDKGYFEVEAGVLGKRAGNQNSLAAPLLVKYSALDWFQLQIGTNNVVALNPGSAARAFDGLIFGAKARFLEQTQFRPSAGLSLHVVTPTTQDPQAIQRTVDAQAWLYISKDIWRFHIDFNQTLFGYDLTVAPTLQGLSSLAVSFDIGRGFGVMTEFYGSYGNTRSVPADGGWLAALSYAPIDEIVIDIGTDVGLIQANRQLSVFLGVTFVPHMPGQSRIVERRAAEQEFLAQAH